MEERTFETAEAAARLRDIGRWAPELQDGFTQALCSYLGDRMGSHDIVPAGFAMVFLLVVEDCVRGKDGFTGRPMPHELVGKPPILYSTVAKMQGRIADVVFGEEFGRLVREELEAAGSPCL